MVTFSARTAFTVSETYFVSSLDLKTAEKQQVEGWGLSSKMIDIIHTENLSNS